MIHRRTFIKQSAIAGSALLASPSFALNPLSRCDNNPPLEIYLFSKCLQFLDYDGMSVAAKHMGFDGLDLTVRPKGHVLPENVNQDLPRATEAMKKHGLATKLFTTKVLDINDPVQYNVLAQASKHGYTHYRTGWYKYDTKKDISGQVDYALGKLQEIATASKELNLNACYHNHSGHYLGTGIWDLFAILNTIDNPRIGAQYDIMHNVIEGGKNWEVGFNLIRPYINSIVLKDFIWEKSDGKWDRKYVPMGTGMVDFKKYFSLLKKHEINVPVSIHMEYDLGGAEHGKVPMIDREVIYGKIKRDLDYVRDVWDSE